MNTLYDMDVYFYINIHIHVKIVMLLLINIISVILSIFYLIISMIKDIYLLRLPVYMWLMANLYHILYLYRYF